MRPLPMVPEACSLSESELEAQIERYRVLARGAREVRREVRRGGTVVAVVVGPDTSDELVQLLVTTEQSCCPFLALDWDAGQRLLRIEALKPSGEPVLELIAASLGALA